MKVYVPVRGEDNEGASAIERPIVGYRSWQRAKAVCRAEEKRKNFGRCDFTEVWTIEVESADS